MEHSVKAPSDEDVCRLTWHLMNNQKISPEEWDSLMASFKATANRSRSATKLFDDAAMSSLIKKTFSSRKAQLFKKEWRPRFLLNHPLKPEEKIAYLSVIASLIGAGGLGKNVLEALQYAAKGQGLLAGLAILFCAMVIDRIVQGHYKRSTARRHAE